MSENFRRISAEKLQSAAISAKNSKSRQNTADPNIGRFFSGSAEFIVFKFGSEV